MEKRFLSVKSLGNQIMKIKKIEIEDSLYSEKNLLSIIKMVQNRSKTCCLAFLNNTSNY